MTRKELIVWLKDIAGSSGMTYERRFEAIKILMAMGEL